MSSNSEWKTIDNLVKFLMVFQSATEVLSGTKYPTISLVLLFSEIVTDLSADSEEVKSVKASMRAALDRRLPLTDLNAVAAMLDPSRRALSSVQFCPIKQDKMEFDLLKAALHKCVGLSEVEAFFQADGSGP